jgi:hypothetical protein
MLEKSTWPFSRLEFKDMFNLQNRRTFLASAGITVASLVSQPVQPKDLPVQGIRENIAGMDADHPVLISYRKAIDAMKKLPATDPLSWQFQANMHGALKADGANEGWRWCMHGNWWFLPWHRGYLYFFEKIVRKMSGDDGFRLPYWPWEKEGQNVLPAPFRDAMYQGLDNALFDAKRVNAANNGHPLRPASASGSFSADWEAVLNTGRFTTGVPELSYGGLRAAKTKFPKRPGSSDHGVMESRAHDLLHDAMGDDTGNMGDPDTAARDPIFWLHHANVDRLWNRWLDIKAHHIPDAVEEKDWYDQEFPFYDDTGKQVVVTVSKILELASNESRYDEEWRVFAAARPPVREKTMEHKIVSVGAIQPMLKLGTKPFTKPLELSEDTKPRLMAALANPPANVEPPAVLLRVEGIKPPKDTGLTFEVFLTKKGEEASKRSYVGPISFFGRRGDHAHDETGFTQGFDVTSLVLKLRSANKGKLPELEVSAIPHSTTGLSDEDLAKKNIEIPISDITLKLVTAEQKK